MNLGVAFLTGLTAGGLGCLAVQGGLLASSLACQPKLGLPASPVAAGQGRSFPDSGARIAQPILWFLLAKLVAYTALGFLLGACGSLFQLTPRVRAGLMIVIGVFILGNGLRLLSAHPLFRGFVLEPPAALLRLIRNTSKRGTQIVTPLFLGGLTVLLPCGISQAMMAAALASGDALQGAALLFAFTLGTLPLFFVVAYSATRLGATLETQFRRIVAVILILLGTASCVLGLNLAGVPITLPRPLSSLAVAPLTANAAYEIEVSAEGYRPSVLQLPAGQPVTVIWKTGAATCCAQSVVIPGLSYQAVLPANSATPLVIPAQPQGTTMNYSCSAGRRTGRLVFVQQ